MQYYIHNTFSGMGEILEYRCMTESNWIQLNIDLGHELPEDFEPKTNLNQYCKEYFLKSMLK